MRAPGRTSEDVLTRTASRRAAIAGGAALLIVTSAATIPSIPTLPVAAVAPAAAAPVLPFTVAQPPGFATGREEHAASRGMPARAHRITAPHAVAVRRKARALPARERTTTRAVRHRSFAQAAPAAGRLASVVAFGRAQLGDPYVYGGDRPGAWDCSGLTRAAYAHIGVDLPHKAAGQAREGVAVPRSRARPGDLVVWGSHHVGIYVGAGRVLHAPRRGKTVRIVDIWGSPTFRRVSDG